MPDTSKSKQINHNDMINRDMEAQHPIEAISGWIEFTEEELKKLFENGGKVENG